MSDFRHLTAALADTQPPGRRDRLLSVTDPEHPDGAVAVRWHYDSPTPYRCGACGPQDRAECEHTFAAGLVLADRLLGLTAAGTEDTPTGDDQ